MMNATSLYVSTCRVVVQADREDLSSWTDLYRLVPYLRQSLSCTVCGNLLIEPHTPTETNCQHHVCRNCKGGRKKLKPSCSWCKDYESYVENVQLRILLQCYKRLCEYITSTSIYRNLLSTANSGSGNGVMGTSSLMEFIQEGAGFKDEYKSTAGLSKSAYSILPCVYTSTSTQTQTALASVASDLNNSSVNDNMPPIRTVSNGSSLYSVMYAGNGTNKLTIKRKNSELEVESADGSSCSGDSRSMTPNPGNPGNPGSFKKPPTQKSSPKNSSGSSLSKRKGCRCGNATATPGKLTCCGQRCPCYVESKACVDCRCRGCRNPHRPGGHKVRPMIPELESFQLQLGNDPGGMCGSGYIASQDQESHRPLHVNTDLEPPSGYSQSSLTMPGESLGNSIKVLGVYTTQLQHIPSALPAALLVGESSGDENSDVDIDI